MNKNEYMLVNAMCLYSAPKVLQLTALFSGLADLLESSMQNFAKSISEEAKDIDLNSFFGDELDELVVDVIDQLYESADDVIEEYQEQFNELVKNNHIMPAEACITYYSSKLPELTPLNQACSARDILAYISLTDSDDTSKQHILDYIHCFSTIFDLINEKQAQEQKQEEENIEKWFVAAKENNINLLITLHESGIDVDLEERGGHFTALAHAVSGKCDDVVMYLLSHGAKPTSFFDSDAPVYIALDNNYELALNEIIKANHPDLDGFDWQKALRERVSDERLDVFKIAIDQLSDHVNLSELATFSIRKSQNALLKLLIDSGLDLNDTDAYEPYSITAVDNDNLAGLSILIENGIDLNIFDRRDGPLSLAISKENPELIKLLLKNGAQLGNDHIYTNIDNIHKLAKILNISVGDCVRHNLFDYHSIIWSEFNFLHCLANFSEESHDADETIDMMSALIDDCGADINALTKDKSDTALSIANDEKVFDYLLSKNPDLSIELEDGKSILSKKHDRFDGRAAKKLLEAGANPNFKIYSTPFIHQAISDKTIYAETIFDTDVDINIVDRNKETIIQKWISRPDIIKPYLLKAAKAGADFSLNTWTGLPIFHALCEFYDVDIINKILELSDVDIHVQDVNGNNATFQACLNRNMPVLEYLYNKGVNINNINKAGGTALLHAVYKDDEELVQFLVEKCGADISIEYGNKSITFIAMQLTSYDSLDYLRNQIRRT